MKTRLITFLLPLLMVGCKEERCEKYAPATVSISWTEYNPMVDVLDYFYCHPQTVEAHIGDTMKILGYFLRPAGQPELPFAYVEGWTGGFFGANPDLTFNQQPSIIVEGSPTLMSAFHEYRYGEMVFMTVVIKGKSDIPGCCVPIICTVFEIETIEKKEKL